MVLRNVDPGPCRCFLCGKHFKFCCSRLAQKFQSRLSRPLLFKILSLNVNFCHEPQKCINIKLDKKNWRNWNNMQIGIRIQIQTSWDPTHTDSFFPTKSWWFTTNLYLSFFVAENSVCEVSPGLLKYQELSDKMDSKSCEFLHNLLCFLSAWIRSFDRWFQVIIAMSDVFLLIHSLCGQEDGGGRPRGRS